MSSSVTNSTTKPCESIVSDESILKIAKEISVKFIEVGRITPASFDKDFKEIYSTIETAVRK